MSLCPFVTATAGVGAGGLTAEACLLLFCVAAVEWTAPAARLWPSAFLPFCFSLGTMGGAPLAWLSHTWRHLHLSLAVPQLVCLPLYLYVTHLLHLATPPPPPPSRSLPLFSGPSQSLLAG